MENKLILVEYLCFNNFILLILSNLLTNLCFLLHRVPNEKCVYQTRVALIFFPSMYVLKISVLIYRGKYEHKTS